ncbi:MAG: hypothetical protein JWO81_3230 [Alphaproteobacteria bacterium]|nr:hypothetical protein [Alphaproteobacteria bacterium]
MIGSTWFNEGDASDTKAAATATVTKLNPNMANAPV